MPSRRLSPETALEIRLSSICTRNQYTKDPGPVIAELIEAAGDRTDILAKVAGTTAGFYDGEYTHALCAALRMIDGAEEWVALGERRRDAGIHGTSGFAAPYDQIMFTGTIRPVETVTIEVEGHSLAEIQEALAKQTPDGFELTDAPVRMAKGTTLISAVGKFARRDGTREIEADDIAALRAKVPEGWQLLTIR